MVRLHISCNTMTDLLRRYYARNGPDLAVFTVSIDGSTPQHVRFNTAACECHNQIGCEPVDVMVKYQPCYG